MAWWPVNGSSSRCYFLCAFFSALDTLILVEFPIASALFWALAPATERKAVDTLDLAIGDPKYCESRESVVS